MTATPEQIARFLSDRAARAENMTHRGEAGRCPDCGSPCGNYLRCRKCRKAKFLERGIMNLHDELPPFAGAGSNSFQPPTEEWVPL